MTFYRLNNIKMPINATYEDVVNQAKKELSSFDITNIRIVKKSLDARNKGNLFNIYAVEFECENKIENNLNVQITLQEEDIDFKNIYSYWGENPVVIGSGPSGMLAGICLAEAGCKPIIIERGAEINERQRDVNTFWHKGKLSIVSNVQFGEGGAGTFSDGKLMTGIKKDRYTAKVLKEFITAGAPYEISYLAKPHIGTDNLVTMTKNIRNKIINLGGEYRFKEKLVNLNIENDELKSITIQRIDGSLYELKTNKLILALGHSARDTFKMLYDCGVNMVQKPFSVGVRIEHKQSDINLAQYGKKYYNSPYLGAADYKLAVHLDNNRSVYTFCMCPGGVVVGATSNVGHVVTNGMSEFNRDKENANSAVLVNVDERDFGSSHPLAGLFFQDNLEKKAFALGGGNYFAPVQLVGDFLNSKATTILGKVKPSYLPGVTPSDFRQLFSEDLYRALQQGIIAMNKKLKGFSDDDAVITAVESRSSSPLRIIRDEMFMCNIKGVYPIGEGAGYAGGIVSAGADGVKSIVVPSLK